MVYLFLYNLFSYLFFPFLFFYLVCKKKIGFDGLKERFGFYPREKIHSFCNNVWIHAASVGEMNVALHFLKEFASEVNGCKFIISTNTYTAKKLAIDKFKEKAKIVYFPFDLFFSSFLALSRTKPFLILVVETELWPNFLHIAYLFRAKIYLINGRISEKKFGYYIFLKFFLKMVIEKFQLCLMRNEFDALRLMRISKNRKKILTVGDIKYDILPKLNYLPNSLHYSNFGFKESDIIFVAGSIHKFEDEIIIEVYKKLKNEFNNLKMILAPRYMNRIPAVESLLKKYNITFRRRTQKNHKLIDCIILDTYGELVNAYYIATIVFVGGSFVKRGGHNIIEPAMLGKVVFFGPHIWNFQEVAKVLIENRCGIKVNTKEELLESLRLHLNSPQLLKEMGKRAKEKIMELSGATKKIINIIKSHAYINH